MILSLCSHDDMTLHIAKMPHIVTIHTFSLPEDSHLPPSPRSLPPPSPQSEASSIDTENNDDDFTIADLGHLADVFHGRDGRDSPAGLDADRSEEEDNSSMD